MKKNGKVKGKVGCNNAETAQYLLKNWQDSDKKGICIIYNHETNKEHVWTK